MYINRCTPKKPCTQVAGPPAVAGGLLVDLDLAGKKALVTAGTRGIGRAVVERLVAEGMQVAICARNAEGVELATKELGPNGEVIGAAVDASDHPALAAWVEEYADRLGGVD